MIKARERLLEKGARLLLVMGDQGSSIASVYKITEKKLEVSGKKKRVKNYKTRKKKKWKTPLPGIKPGSPHLTGRNAYNHTSTSCTRDSAILYMI